MMFGLQLPRLRLTIFALALLAQVYLLARGRRTIRASRRSDRFKSRAICLVGVTIGMLFLLNGYLLFVPLPWVDPPAAARNALFYPAAIWSFGSLLSALLLLLTQVAGWLGRMMVRLCRGRIDQAASTPVNVGRRHFLRAGVSGLTAAPLVLAGYGAAYAAKTCDIQELTLPFGQRLRVVQLTDIHAGLYMTRDEIRRYVDRVIALQPDLFVLTGDYISNSMVFFPGCVEEMARVHAPYGTFATLGNHEHWYGRPEEIQAILRQHGISLLNNAHRMIHTKEGPVAIAGIDDLRAGEPDLDAALRGRVPAIPTLLLSHLPEIFPRAAAHGIPLTLAGHYHGGQIQLPLPGGAISMAHLRTPYPEGLYRIGPAHLYVSRGIGTTFTPVRLNAPPEITVFHLT
jgi:predicted MPP superfamily phosphohydrolase